MIERLKEHGAKTVDDIDYSIEGDKEAIAANDAIARDPRLALTRQGEWAETRLKGNLEGLNRHEQQLSETEARLNKLSDNSENE